MRQIKKIKEISEAFGRAIAGLELFDGNDEHYSKEFVTAEIIDWEVRKDETGRGYVVKIKSLETPEGIIDETRTDLCPHKYLTEVTGLVDIHPSVVEFRRKYNVRKIESPHQECNHFKK